MVVRAQAAPPTPWSRNLSEPRIDSTAYVHSFSNLIGDVRVGPKVLIAPGTSIRADEGFPFAIGDGTNIQDGVVIHGLEKGRVIGDDQESYSVWIGKNACITHMALIHGPAYIGDNCFIGFRSTVFNARVGAGCIVMMHALVQDVEVPPGRYVPSGAVIINQEQADRLPEVQDEDRQFAHHVVEINEALRAGYQCAADVACIANIRNQASHSSNGNGRYSAQTEVGGMSVKQEIIEQVRSLLAQGYQIGTEHADERRFRRNSWQSCAPIQSRQESQVLRDLQACLAEHQGEYVRLIGIDPKAKRRVLETTIQTPRDPVAPPAGVGANPVPSYNQSYAGQSYSSGNGAAATSSGLSDEVVEQVRSLVSQGYRIGLEHADERRFRRNSWQSGVPIQGKQVSQVLNELQACLSEYQGEYVRLIGIDPKAKRRVLETLIQDPKSAQAQSTKSRTASQSSYSSAQSTRNGSAVPTGLNEDAAEQVRSLVSQGYRVGLEYADERRFRRNSWQNEAPIEAQRPAQVLAELEARLANHSGEYVRLIGIDPKAKRRVLETLIQDPRTQTTPAPAPARENAQSFNGASASASKSVYNNRNGAVKTSLSPETVEQVRSLLAQGYRIGTEHADERRFRRNSWQSCAPIQEKQASQVFSALEACLAEHEGEYVRLIGIDPKAKRRVLETTIQQP